MVGANAVCPADVIVPVILLPGIMGSRLKHGNRVVWDPDDKMLMVRNYAMNAGSVPGPDMFRWRESRNVRAAAAKRKSLLVGSRFDKNYLVPDEFARLKGLTEAQISRNWSSVALSSYGDILRRMESTFPLQLSQAVRKVNPHFNLVKMPVYACGYNWSASNYDSGRAAAKHIKTWVAEARSWAAKNNAECPGAILVTHSMGGFVARSAALMHGAASDIMAVISTVMPTDGAPAAYKRFHFGFENPGIKMDLATYVVLGRQGSLVTALLGHMPGAQELLPNKRYRANDGSAKWLHILNPKRNLIGNMVSGGAAFRHLPNSNPYTEIYRREDKMYRAANPDWLYPEGFTGNNPFTEFLRNNQMAEAWHDRIQGAGDFHELTYLCHSGDKKMKTFDLIAWEPDMTFGGLGRSVSESNVTVKKGQTPDYQREHLIWGSESSKHIDGGYLGLGTDWKIREPGGDGDKTVPVSSSVARVSSRRREIHRPGYEHEAAIRSPIVIDWVRDRCAEILGSCELYG